MLTKKDLEQIEEVVNRVVNRVVDNKINTAFSDFYDNFFEPHVTQSVKQHQEIVDEIKGLKKQVSNLEEETGEIKEFIKDHEKRITTLETVASVKN